MRNLCLILALIVVVVLDAFRIELGAQETENSNTLVASRDTADDAENETLDTTSDRTDDTTTATQTLAGDIDNDVVQWLGVIEFAHKVISNKKDDVHAPPLAPATGVFSNLKPHLNRTHTNELHTLLHSPGFVSSQRSMVTDRSWLFHDEHTEYRFKVNYRLLLPDVEKFVNAIAGGNVFRDVLDSLKNDPQGPRIDVRGDLIEHLGEEVIVIVDTAVNTPRGTAMLVAFATKDAEAVGRFVERTALAESSVVKVDDDLFVQRSRNRFLRRSTSSIVRRRSSRSIGRESPSRVEERLNEIEKFVGCEGQSHSCRLPGANPTTLRRIPTLHFSFLHFPLPTSHFALCTLHFAFCILHQLS